MSILSIPRYVHHLLTCPNYLSLASQVSLVGSNVIRDFYLICILKVFSLSRETLDYKFLRKFFVVKVAIVLN